MKHPVTIPAVDAPYIKRQNNDHNGYEGCHDSTAPCHNRSRQFLWTDCHCNDFEQHSRGCNNRILHKPYPVKILQGLSGKRCGNRHAGVIAVSSLL
jgi:hypothetical protein